MLYSLTMVTKNWYSDWFDSKYYHVLYKNRGQTDAEFFIRNLITFLNPDENSHILDLGCGKGRHSKFLFDNGLKVTGLDLSENSINCAKIHETERLHFSVHDMRNVYQRDQFNFVFNLFTSFGYFNSQIQNQQVMNAVDVQLKQDGILVLDYLNAQKVRNTLVPNEIITHDGIKFNITRHISNGNVFKRIKFEVNKKAYSFEERVELLEINDFKTYLNATTLRLIHTFGGYELKEFQPEKSDRLILIAKKEK